MNVLDNVPERGQSDPLPTLSADSTEQYNRDSNSTWNGRRHFAYVYYYQ